MVFQSIVSIILQIHALFQYDAAYSINANVANSGAVQKRPVSVTVQGNIK